jgi:hypothetical protein
VRGEIVGVVVSFTWLIWRDYGTFGSSIIGDTKAFIRSRGGSGGGSTGGGYGGGGSGGVSWYVGCPCCEGA